MCSMLRSWRSWTRIFLKTSLRELHTLELLIAFSLRKRLFLLLRLKIWKLVSQCSETTLGVYAKFFSDRSNIPLAAPGRTRNCERIVADEVSQEKLQNLPFPNTGSSPKELRLCRLEWAGFRKGVQNIGL